MDKRLGKEIRKNVFLKGQWVPNKQTKMDGLRKTIRDFNWNISKESLKNSWKSWKYNSNKSKKTAKFH